MSEELCSCQKQSCLFHFCLKYSLSHFCFGHLYERGYFSHKNSVYG